jgi:hypothetical protein
MGYVESSLGRNERIHYIAHFPMVSYIIAYGALILAIIFAVASYKYHQVAGYLPAIMGVVAFLGIMVPIWTTEVGVTNQRLIFKRGIIQRETQEMQLRTVEGVSLDQDILGRIFGYGRLVIEGTGNDHIELPALGDPLALRRALQEAIGDVQKVAGSNGGNVATQPT